MRAHVAPSSNTATTTTTTTRWCRDVARRGMRHHRAATTRDDGDEKVAADDDERLVNMFRNYENRTAFAPATKKRLPVTLVTGFLGSGKTTLAKRALENRRSLRVAAAVNDFAAVNVDARLVRRATEVTMNGSGNGRDGGGNASSSSSGAVQVTELTNGCLCCTLRDDLEKGVVELLNADADGSHLGLFDYLLIETSGLVDPGEVVSRLDRNFGALTRARLDGVVCVVDAETAADGGPLVEREVWDAQLACADIVLLNKIDLLQGEEERLRNAKDLVASKAPGARVIECVNANAPLTSILDVEMLPQPEGKSGHDWGTGPLPYVLSPTGGRLRKQKPEDAPKIVTRGPLSLDKKTTTHFAGGKQSKCNSFAYETSSPLVFARFQHWATKMIPKATLRSKGVLTLAEDANRISYDFHFSGKSRLELEPSVGELVSATSTCLVIIGVGLDEESVMRNIRALETPLPDEAVRVTREVKRLVAATMAEDLRFEVDENSLEDESALVSFRLTGAASNGFTTAELEESHGVDFNAMNIDLLRAVNTAGRGGCLAPTNREDKRTKFGAAQVFLRLAVLSGFEENYSDPSTLASACVDAQWMQIRERATSVLGRYVSHIPQCKCGF